jgi:HAD superfamily hydrolase (TIGR01509 family)
MMNKKTVAFKAAIFDLDGTLADSLQVWNHIDVAFFELHGLALPEDYQDSIKDMGFPQAAAYTKERFFFQQSEQEIMRQWMEMARLEYAERVALKDGVCDYLHALKSAGIKIGLATASGPELYEPLLKRHGVFDCFSSFATTVRAGKDKTSPDVYLLCAEELGCKAEDCMVYEDLLTAVLTAKTAGMMVTGVYDRYWHAEQDQIIAAADRYIRSFAQALPL